MASSLCRRIYCSFLSMNPNTYHHQSLLISLQHFSTETSSDSASGSDSDSTIHPEPESDPLPQSSYSNNQQRDFGDRPLENGLDAGIYRAILVGKVGQNAIEKKLRSGRTVTMLSIGTGGIRNNRRPLQNEEPRDYANRSMVQWHRVSIYPERLGALVAKNAVPGLWAYVDELVKEKKDESFTLTVLATTTLEVLIFIAQIRHAFSIRNLGSILYLEGNLETKIFNDPITGLTRRVREIAIRRDGRVVFLGEGSDAPSQAELKGVGYY
ncbi:Nucleic acid-binding, OB-fold [Cynara cardunculus var. scolymus]|uniref:Nucleic acid-binding, OB-fold n=1 Tax=Cynara cardunculus var. scolymus TaxID=59895 RepID=A0A103YCB0_CYNCS|nr:Nucleic acid-binding, OB-fold [Cynara cardunculus var. scolymus]